MRIVYDENKKSSNYGSNSGHARRLLRSNMDPWLVNPAFTSTITRSAAKTSFRPAGELLFADEDRAAAGPRLDHCAGMHHLGTAACLQRACPNVSSIASDIDHSILMRLSVGGHARMRPRHIDRDSSFPRGTDWLQREGIAPPPVTDSGFVVSQDESRSFCTVPDDAEERRGILSPRGR